MIDLAHFESEYRQLIMDAVLSFERQNPGVTWAFLGVDVTIPYGSVAVNFDTASENAAVLRAYPNSASFSGKGIDEYGRYNNNCAGYAFHCWRESRRDDWSEQYFGREGRPLEILFPDGRLVEISGDVGDEGVNEIVFPYFVGILADEVNNVIGNSRSRDLVCRVGVQMCDSEWVKFWRVS